MSSESLDFVLLFYYQRTTKQETNPSLKKNAMCISTLKNVWLKFGLGYTPLFDLLLSTEV